MLELADSTEVNAIVNMPLGTFLAGAPISLVERTVRGWPLRYGAYPLGDLRVWGATARILGQIGAVLGRASESGEGERVPRS